ncbi:MAG: extracellular solute-binding protein [Oscillospiraceae bacterium]|nr:extracellular solute-binding protein [Oscillospiraceae bacterium]
MKIFRFEKIFAAMIAVIAAPIIFAACGGPDATNGENKKNEASEAPFSGEIVESANGKILPDIPDADYGGHKFTILVALNFVSEEYFWNDFDAEEENGDTINDAVYRRNTYVEDTYNVKIVTVRKSILDMVETEGLKSIRTSVSSGDYTYDAALLSTYSACPLATEGLLMDLNSMAPLDLSKPWWDAKANEDLMIKGKMFYTAGDISNVASNATNAILFNKKLVQELGLEDPYPYVKEGKWTFDKLMEMALPASADLNGDGKYDFEDRYGGLIWDNSLMAMVNAVGEQCAKIDASGEIVLTFNSEKTLDIFDKFTDFLFDKTQALGYQRQDWAGVRANQMFENNQALFYLKMIDEVPHLRAMEVDFGILPYPKFDENQKNYYNTVDVWHTGFICAPVLQEDASRTGAIFEALSAESKYTLRPAYYDRALKGKHARDDESQEMLDIIFSTRNYDVGWMYQIGGYVEELLNLFRNYKKDFTSMYEKYEPKAIKDIEKINTEFGKFIK